VPYGENVLTADQASTDTSAVTALQWISLAAIFLAPLLAVQAQKLIESARDKRARRERLFHILMGTRAARVSAEHVQALNMIDLEFYGARFLGMRFRLAGNRRITECWREYRDHLNSHPGVDAEKHTIDAWGEAGNTFFVALLHALSQCLGYDFDRVELAKGVYSPTAHFKTAITQIALQEWLLGVANGTQSVPLRVTQSDEEQLEVRALRAALTDFLARCERVELRAPGDPGAPATPTQSKVI
jgi:Family of unknown function (DUF6680)